MKVFLKLFLAMNIKIKMVVQKQSDIGFHHFELKFLKMQLMSEGISVGYSFLGNN